MTALTFLHTTIFYNGASVEIGTVLASLEIKQPLQCNDKGLVELSHDVSLAIFGGLSENLTQQRSKEAVVLYKKLGCDGVVALGADSSMDVTKDVALAVTHEADQIDYTVGCGGVQNIGGVAPLVFTPATSGTGSEVASGTVSILTNDEKSIFASQYLVPLAAVHEPELRLELPSFLTAAPGMDAVTHGIEVLIFPKKNSPSEAVGFVGNERALHSMIHTCGADQSFRRHHGTLYAINLADILDFSRYYVGNKYERLNHAMNTFADQMPTLVGPRT
jgi:alcohol dehydrogenase class IV